MVVLDASAVLAILFAEPGADTVQQCVRGAVISSVNLTEVLEKIARKLGRNDIVLPALAALEVTVAPFDVAQAGIAADLKTRVGRNDSLADRACMALALHRRIAVVTGDRAWAELDIGLDVRLFR